MIIKHAKKSNFMFSDFILLLLCYIFNVYLVQNCNLFWVPTQFDSTLLYVTFFLFFQVKTYIKPIDFQSKSELLTTENFLPFTDEVTVELVHKCIQQLHLLALHFEILGYIPGLLNGLEYLRRAGDFSGDNITWRLL